MPPTSTVRLTVDNSGSINGASWVRTISQYKGVKSPLNFIINSNL